MSDKQVVTIDDKQYNLADLSEEARQQLINLRLVPNSRWKPFELW